MSKKIIFNLSKNQLINSNSKKEFLEKSYYLDDGIDKCLIKNQKIYFFFNKTLNSSKKNFLNKKIKRLINRFKAIDNKIETKIIFENNIKTKGIKNSFLKLQKSNQIEQVSDGLFSIKGNLLKKINKLDRFLDNYAKKEKYSEMFAHSLIPLETLYKNGYLSNFAHHTTVCSHFERNIITLDKISNLKKYNGKFIKNKLAKPELAFSPTVCYHCFENLKNKKIYTNTVFNIKSACSRYESKNYKTFERLHVFTMREFVAYGSVNYIETFLEKNLNYFKRKFLDLDIKFRIVTASDPFFSDSGMKRMLYQNINLLKKEFQFWLPNEKKWLAVGSFNNHLNSLSIKYKIKGKNNEFINSGCIGWGYERFIYALISQNKTI